MKKLVKLPLTLAGASVGMGIVGKAFDSSALTEAGSTAANFISPAINITMGGYVIKQLKNLK